MTIFVYDIAIDDDEGVGKKIKELDDLIESMKKQKNKRARKK